ncbi:hypothetical protein K4F52_007266 [Lecanicillium sp. MT-2017a]|nr:hypothetical protein K4F52_007266 [Lecanicillium sp. MT-2017a]
MSADTTPITAARFAAALKELSVQMLHLKVLEIRNSIAHLQYSNDQLKPYAEGTAAASDGTSETSGGAAAAEPDQDCIDAIRENEQVIERMAERIALVRIEVEERGVSWNEFQSKEETEAAAAAAAAAASADRNGTSATTNGQQQSPWTDGTFQTGVIRNGEVHMDAQAGVRDTGAGANTSQRTEENGEDDGDGLHL